MHETLKIKIAVTDAYQCSMHIKFMDAANLYNDVYSA